MDAIEAVKKMRKKSWRCLCNVHFFRKMRSQFCVLLLSVLCTSVQAGDIQLYAAASLTDALIELSNDYRKANPDIAIKKSFAGSSILAKQIEKGAPADIFIAADNDWLDYVQKRDLLLVESRKKLFSNELVLIAPRASDLKVQLDSAFDLSASFTGRLCTGDTISVPVGRYAKQSLIHYGWWDNIALRVVGAEDVRTALSFVERAECSLGIVYKTDANLTKKVKILASFPANSHQPIEYSGALTKHAGVEAKAFWAYLQSDAGKRVFAGYGFTLIN